MMNFIKKYSLSISVSIFVVFILGMMKLMMDTPMLMLDRFMDGAGWIQIIILAGYGAFLAHKMRDPGKSAIWRKRSWLFFSIIFFAQFALGLIADERFLMSGNLHLPAPFMIIAGPVYRGQMTIMPILLISSIVLSGPAWCSHYCYFGAWDGLAASRKSTSSRATLRPWRASTLSPERKSDKFDVTSIASEIRASVSSRVELAAEFHFVTSGALRRAISLPFK